MRYKIFFYGLLTSFGAVSTLAASTARIQTASNIDSDRVVLSIFTGDERKPRALVELDVKELKTQSLPWPAEVKEQEVMGLFLIKDQILLISQATAGGGKFPHVQQYDRTVKQWSDRGEIKCRSFDQVEIAVGMMHFDCEADPRSQSKARRVSIKIERSAGSKVESLKVVLPLEKATEGKTTYKLEGSMFAWKAIQVSSGPDHKKILTAEQLLP